MRAASTAAQRAPTPKDITAGLCGFGVGVLVGLTGVGDGSVMTPRLLSVFKLNPAVAIGTDLCSAALTQSAGALSHHRCGHVDWRITAWLRAGSLPAALATRAWMQLSGLTKSGDGVLTTVLGTITAAERGDRAVPQGLVRAGPAAAALGHGLRVGRR